MKYLYAILLSFLIISKTFANDWQNTWIRAVEFCDDKKFEEALNMFNIAIVQMEDIKDVNHPYIYVDRARLNLMLENNEATLIDLEIALKNEMISKFDRTRAYVTRLMARSRLGMEAGVLEDLKNVGESLENKPIIEETKDYIIIRNMSDCECYAKLMSSYFINSEKCSSENDIKMLSSNICIIKKSCNCGCKKVKDENSKNNTKIQDNRNMNGTAIDGCKSMCDRVAISGTALCSKWFKTSRCQIACAVAACELQKGCYWCCEGGDFYQKCIKPFEFLQDYIKAPCDPAWD
ncbi:MAG: hypothetical protein H0W88_12480 [Parachlamydiaceae bacterium]|nr:hypothetical protein [Parachlamydiaceae bacterium]